MNGFAEETITALEASFFSQDFDEVFSPRRLYRQVQYRVVFLGSSLVGYSYGNSAYQAAHTFLQGKSDQGKAKCFHWWCQTCKSDPLLPGGSPAGHVIEVSIPNVLSIIEDHKVEWHWQEPDSDWARSRAATAEQEFQALVERKSRPKWKVILQSYLP